MRGSRASLSTEVASHSESSGPHHHGENLRSFLSDDLSARPILRNEVPPPQRPRSPALRLRGMGDGTDTFFAIIAYVLVVAWLSRRIALDMDSRGKAGWAYGLMTFMIPPLGLALWMLDRHRVATHREWRPELGSVGDVVLFVLLIVTFPWGVIVWLLMNRRASPEG